MSAILERIYPSRIRAIEALHSGTARNPAIDTLKDAAAEVRDAGQVFERAPAGRLWAAFADALDCVCMLEAWNSGVLSAERGADRHLRAARKRLEHMKADQGATGFEAALIAALEPMSLKEPDVRGIRRAIAGIAMPVGILADPEPQLPDWALRNRVEKGDEPVEIAVAFLEFAIDGRPADRIQWLAPQQTHDLHLAVKVSRWPEKAERVRLCPVSIEPTRTFELPVFEFEKPSGGAPHFFSETGRMVLHTPQAMAARPYEFMYAAEFSPLESEQPLVVAGQRVLRLNGVDPRQNPITGYAAVDRKLLEVRDQLRREPRIPEHEIADALQVLVVIGNLMGQAVQDALFPEPLLEAPFQAIVRQWLRSSQYIGAELEEQAHAAGGRTDLSFRGTRIELKSERDAAITLEDCKRFAAQAGAYAVGTNRLLSVLCVLDATPKETLPFPVEDGIQIVPVETSTSPVYVVTCLVQGGLPKPSALSR